MHLKIIKIVFMNTLINQIIVSLRGNFHLLFKSGLSEKNNAIYYSYKLL